MVAAFGVQAFAIVPSLPPVPVTPSEAEALATLIADERAAAETQEEASEDWNRVALFFNEVEAIAVEAIEAAGQPGVTAVQVSRIYGAANDKIAALGADNRDLAALIFANPGLYPTMVVAVDPTTGTDWDPSVLNVMALGNGAAYGGAGYVAGAGITDFDPEIEQAIAWSENFGSDAVNHTEKADIAQAELDEIEAEAAAAAAAEAAAKLQKAAEKAAKAAVSDPKTSADWLLYWAAYNQVYANNSLSTAKTNAETAKKSIAVAQKGAFTAAKEAITWAQAEAYSQMQTEITKAVNDYVAGVNEALNEFYGELYG